MGIERLREFWPEWHIEKELGEGAYGKVYSAVREDHSLKSYAAIKVITIPQSKAEVNALRAEGLSEEETKAYFDTIITDFVNEIKLMETLKGVTNIVSVEDYRILEATEGFGWDIFIRMELLTPFSEYIGSHSMSEADVIDMAIDICSALEVCYKNHIIHRDIKPANIFVSKMGDYKIGDFGVAKELEKTTGAMSAKGTYSYMAPEVAQGRRYDATVDIYSLGLVMYGLLNKNRQPFIDPNKTVIPYNDRMAANDKRLSGEPLPPPCNASELTAKVILTACSFDPKKRFSNPTALKNVLINCKKSLNQSPVNEKSADYSKPEADCDETVRVNKPDTNYDATVKANMPGDAKKPKNTNNTHDDPPVIPQAPKKKKGKAGKIITGIVVWLIICALTVAGAYLLINRETKTGDTDGNDTKSNEDIKESTSSQQAPDPQNDPASSLITDFVEIGVGDIIELGCYEQDNNTANGAEPIEWIVLSADGQKALVVSKNGLDAVPYHDELDDVDYSESYINDWLYEELYQNAFSAEDKTKIVTTSVEYQVVMYGNGASDAYNDHTLQRLFLLSEAEVEEYMTESQRVCKATDYAVANGAREDWWWLRTPGNELYSIANVNAEGETVRDGGRNMANDTACVRPAMWIVF